MSNEPESQIPISAIHQEWLTPQEVGQDLRIPTATFYRWRFKHVVPTVHRIGRHLSTYRADLDAWLSEREER